MVAKKQKVGHDSLWGEARRTRENRFDDKRDALMAAAAKLFRQKGFDDTSLAELAEILNITKPTVYYYVKSKDELIYSIKRDAQDKVLSIVTEAEVSSGPGFDRFRSAMIHYAEFITTDYGVCLTIVPARHMDPDNRVSFFRRVKKTNETLATIFKEGVEDGSIRPSDVTLAIRSLFGALNWMSMWFRPEGKLSARQVAEKVVDILLTGIKS